jgi:D-alanyl-D-alanine carboxypeptidase
MEHASKLAGSPRAENQVPDQPSHVLQKRLDVIIQLMLEMTAEPAKTTAAKMSRLLALGCSQSETAHILGKESKDVTSYVSKQKKRSARKPAAPPAAKPSA